MYRFCGGGRDRYNQNRWNSRFKYLVDFLPYVKTVLEKHTGKFIFVVDNTEKEYEDNCRTEIKKYLQDDKIEFISVKSNESYKKCIGGKRDVAPSMYTLYITCMDLIKEYATKDTIVFVQEDDFIVEDELYYEKMIQFCKHHPFDFVGLFDSPMWYNGNRQLMSPRYHLEIEYQFDHHWRTAPSIGHAFCSHINALKIPRNKKFLYNPDRCRRDIKTWTNIWSQGKSKIWSAVPGLLSLGIGPKHPVYFKD